MRESSHHITIGTYRPTFAESNRDYRGATTQLASAQWDVCTVQGATPQFAKQLRNGEGISARSMDGLVFLAREGVFTFVEGHMDSVNLLASVAARVDSCPEYAACLPRSTVACQIAARIPACACQVTHEATKQTIILVTFDFGSLDGTDGGDGKLRLALLRELCRFLWDPDTSSGVCASWGSSHVVLAGHLGCSPVSVECQSLLSPASLPVQHEGTATLLPWSVTASDPATNLYSALYALPAGDPLAWHLRDVCAVRFGETSAALPTIRLIATSEVGSETFSDRAVLHPPASADADWCEVVQRAETVAIQRILRVTLACDADMVDATERAAGSKVPAAIHVRASYVSTWSPVGKPNLGIAHTASRLAGELCDGAAILFTLANLQNDATQQCRTGNVQGLHCADLLLLA